MTARRSVVVGSGISGLASAALLAKRGDQVSVVDAAEVVGGLLSSTSGPEGTSFDHGTHVPQESGCGPLDEILFSEMGQEPWEHLPTLLAGTVLGGTLARSPFPDLRVLPAAGDAVERDLRAAVHQGPAGPPSTAREALTSEFGQAAAEQVLVPVVEGFFGESADRLVPDAHRFLFARVLAFTEEETRELKRAAPGGDALGFHDQTEMPSSRRAWYPTTGGAGRWVEDVRRAHLDGAGARVHLGHGVHSVHVEDGAATRVELTDGTVLPCDELVWTVPVVGFLRAAGVPLPEGLRPPTFRTSVLHHLVLDRSASTDLHYVVALDPDREVFRFTSYEALGAAGPPRASIEIVTDVVPDDLDESRGRAVRELLELGLLAPGTRVTWSASDAVATGFPVPTVDSRDTNLRLAALAEEAASNVRLLGRSTGRAFFMADVLRGCWEALGAPADGLSGAAEASAPPPG